MDYNKIEQFIKQSVAQEKKRLDDYNVLIEQHKDVIDVYNNRKYTTYFIKKENQFNKNKNFLLKNNQQTQKTIFKMAAFAAINPEAILINGVGISESYTIEKLLNSPYLIDLLMIIINEKRFYDSDDCNSIDKICQKIGFNSNDLSYKGISLNGLTVNDLEKIKIEQQNDINLKVKNKFKFSCGSYDNETFVINSLNKYTDGDKANQKHYFNIEASSKTYKYINFLTKDFNITRIV